MDAAACASSQRSWVPLVVPHLLLSLLSPFFPIKVRSYIQLALVLLCVCAAGRRHASTDSEEDARPLKKASGRARPSYAGLDDPDYEAKLHDEELVPVRSTTKSKKKQAADASRSKSEAPSGPVLSMANPTNRGRRTINYQSMDPSEYAALRSDVNQFAAPANATNHCFRTLVQHDIATS